VNIRTIGLAIPYTHLVVVQRDPRSLRPDEELERARAARRARVERGRHRDAPLERAPERRVARVVPRERRRWRRRRRAVVAMMAMIVVRRSRRQRLEIPRGTRRGAARV
jgi:hypothetical protein